MKKAPELKVILDATQYIIGTDTNTLFKTSYFTIIVNQDNQLVPGMLKIIPIDAKLGAWDNWQKRHWLELLRVIRLCELVLIKTFEERPPNLLPSLDDKLINCMGKQRRVGKKLNISFDIVPRYKNKVELIYLLGNINKTVKLEDIRYARPFDFKITYKSDEELYTYIVLRLRNTLKNTNFNDWTLEDNFLKQKDCIFCTHSRHHPAKTGLVEVADFRVALDARSQEEKGRSFCSSNLHIPALRYWQDSWIEMIGDIFFAYRNAINKQYPAAQREFDLLCLMNLAKSKADLHTHLHFIPRTTNSKNYGEDFSLEPASYIPLSSNEKERKKTVTAFQQQLIKELLTTNLKIKWPKANQDTYEEKIKLKQEQQAKTSENSNTLKM